MIYVVVLTLSCPIDSFDSIVTYSTSAQYHLQIWWPSLFVFWTGKWYSWSSSCKAFCICQDVWQGVHSIRCAKKSLSAKFAFWSSNAGVYKLTPDKPYRFLNMHICWFIFWSRQRLLRYKTFLSLEKRRRLCSMHKKVNCGDLRLFLLHNLAIRLAVFFLVLNTVLNYWYWNIWIRLSLVL